MTSKGQVTIPIELRRKYGITPDVEVEFEEGPRGPVVVVSRSDRRRRLEAALDEVRGSWDFEGMSADQYMNFIRGYDEDADDPGFADRHERAHRPSG